MSSMDVLAEPAKGGAAPVADAGGAIPGLVWAFRLHAMAARLLISGRHQALCAVDATRRVLEGGHRVETVAALLEKIIDEVADTMDRIADKIGTGIDDIEERILAGEVKPDMRGSLGRS